MITRTLLLLALVNALSLAAHARPQVSDPRSAEAQAPQAMRDPRPMAPLRLAQVQIEDSTVRVHVTGAVVRPGVYSLPRGARGIDAIQAAGGSTRQAALSEINLAGALQDGERLEVPRQGDRKPTPLEPRAKATGSRRPAAQNTSKRIVPLNTASLAELESLPGIGPRLARDIVRYREQKGRFRSLEELKEVPGIGERRFERLAPRLEL